MSRVNSCEITSKFWIMKSITGFQPDTMISRDGWSIPENIILADPRFDKPQRVDMLIGGGYIFDLLSVGQIRVASDSNFPILQKTMLGWIMVGKLNGSNTFKSYIFHSVVRKFWEMESLPNEQIVTEEQRKCEEVFIKSVRRLPSGRFSVSLPFKSDPNILGSSYETAKRRFLSLERKLSTEGVMREMYHAFINEYIDLGHMSFAESSIPDYPHYFIPHQRVLRPESVQAYRGYVVLSCIYLHPASFPALPA
ncbi:uncharacterized protein LOC142224747 [Haematobia irritans]|uniref:uncharacterized protein LOC142224747 n=1 Tax=Haematobia irritans TaxID=7368 RepID=UPI003F505525